MKRLLSALLALALAVPLPSVWAQTPERIPYTQAELDQMLAPIALYPDSLLSQVLMASTYPLDVVEAARWSRAHAGLQGDEAVRSAQDQDWDPSVKSLLAFPDLLARMDEKLDWTKRLGEAFLEQQPHVMETVQQLRRKAEAAGQLASGERLRVVDEGGAIVIEQANPQVVYVPYYDPLVAYGSWWWPAYPPMVWAPWPGYVAYRPGIWWGAGVGISAGFFFGGVSWSQRHVIVTRASPYYARPRAFAASRTLVVGAWRHAPDPRRGVVNRSPAVQGRFVSATPARAPRAAPVERRDDRRSRAMPPALRASPPVAAEARPQAQPRPGVQQPRQDARPQFRASPPVAAEAQPRAQPGPSVRQPREDARPQFRVQPRERGGGWQRNADRTGRRG